MIYPVELAEASDNGFIVTCPDLPEVEVWGGTESEALRAGWAAVEAALGDRLTRFRSIPRPQAWNGRPIVRIPLRTSIKVMLQWRMIEVGSNHKDLAQRLEWPSNQVSSLLDPDGVASLDQYETAFAALDATLDVTLDVSTSDEFVVMKALH